MSWPPGVQDFKNKFFREFIYGDGLDTVVDRDIVRALGEVPPLYNQALLDTVADQSSAYLYLAAHMLWENIDMAGGLSAVPRGRGVRGDTEGIVNSKSVGQVSVNYEPPPDYVKTSPTMMRLWKSKFGAKYIEMIRPRLIGNVAVVCGPNQVVSFAEE